MPKILARIALFLIVAGALGVLIVYWKFNTQLNERIAFHPPPILLPIDKASLDEGRRLVRVKGCYDCHGDNLAGKVFAEAGPIGRFVGTNLTPNGNPGGYQDTDWVRAIRYGLTRDGRKLIFMPSAEFSQLSNEDLAKMIAYLKTVPAADMPSLPKTEVGPLAKFLYVIGKFPLMFQAELIDRQTPPPDRVAAAPDAEYGKYIAASCTGCHGVEMKGGPIPGVPPSWPPAADLTKAGRSAKWSYKEFETLMRTGLKPDGKKIDPTHMPWPAFALMNQTEMTALFAYLQNL